MTTTALLSDLRASARALARRPRFAVLAAGAYTLGIGVVTAVFGLVDDVVLDPLPWPAADRVVGVWEAYPEMDADRVPAAPAKIDAWRGLDGAFASVAAWRLDDYDLTGLGDPERLGVGRVEPEIFGLLGVEAALGRTFSPDEAEPGRDGVVLLTNAFWTERFGADPGVLGRTLTLEGRRYDVVGVLPPHAQFPEAARVVVPLVIDVPQSRSAHAFRVLARLAPGVDVEEARTGLEALARRLEAEYPDTDRGWGVTVVPLRDQLVGDLTSLLLVLLGAGGLVFLVACANGASLLLVRASGRRRELGVRTSLGAPRGRLVWHLAAESLLLSLVGGVAGLVLARVLAAGLLAVVTVDLPATAGEAFDPTVYAFAFAATLVAGLLFGLLPALRGTVGRPMEVLREGASTASRGRTRVRNVVVAAEVAMATLLLAGSGLFLRSANALARVDPGFDPVGLLTASVQPPRDRYPGASDRLDLYRSLLDEARALPGVTRAALVNYLPLAGKSDAFRFQVEGRPVPSFADLDVTALRAVSASYFDAMGMDVLRGRGLDEADGEGDAPVTVVNRTMARRFWPGEEVLGQRISFSGDDGPWVRVVGVVEDVRHAALTREPDAEAYVPLAQEPWPSAFLVLRTRGDPVDLVGDLRQAVGRADPLLPVVAVSTGEQLVASAAAPWRFQATLVTVLALVAVVLAVTGVYGLMAWVVQERTGEMALRRALGARTSDLRRLVGGSTLRLAGTGTVVGLAGAAALSEVVRGMLYGVGPTDPLSYAGAAFLLLAVAVAASWIPARRAGRVDPAEALRL
ncbi:MAG: ABC transporter permease [Gemmatimonadota bacterium]|jgi:putative ABC transport system permease protein